LVLDYEKETHDREVQLYSLSRLFNLSSLGSATPFRAHKNLVVLTSAGLFRHKCVSLNCPRNYSTKLARLRLSNSRSTRDFRNLAKPCPNHTSYPFRDPEEESRHDRCVTLFHFPPFSYTRDF